MKYNFDEIIERHNTCSSKWDSGPDGPLDKDCIPMWVADMDFACAPQILDAVHKVADRKIFGYSHLPENYYSSLIAFFERRHGFTCTQDEIIFSQGVVPMLHNGVKALTKPGDGVIVQPPVYYPFFSAITSNGRNVVENPLIYKDNNWTIDFDDLEKKAAQDDTKMMIICSPHNPVGRVWTEEELRRIEEICVKYDLYLLCDEIHNDLVRRDVEHVSVMKLFPDAQNILCCTAPSKTFNLAALGASHAICKNPEMRAKVAEVTGRQGCNPFTAAAVVAAMTECDDWLDELCEYLDSNLELFYKLCGEYFPKSVPSKIEGTYLAWLDVSAYTTDTKALEAKLIKDCGVYIEAGDAFGGQGFVRVNLACPKAYIEEAFKRCAKLVG